MSQHLTSTTAQRSISTVQDIQPALPGRAADDALNYALNSMEGGKLPAYAAPGDARRGEFERMLADYRQWLRPASASEIKMDLYALFAAFPRRVGDDDANEVKLAVYGIALSETPAWAAHRAIRGYIKGQIGDRKFCPTPPELATKCADYMAPYVRAIARIEAVLNAEKIEHPSAAEKARIGEGFRKLSDEIGKPEATPNLLTPEQDRAQAERELQAIIDAGVPEIKASDALRESMEGARA